MKNESEQEIKGKKTFHRLSSMAIFWRRFKKGKTAIFGLGVFFFIVSLAILAPYIAPHDPIEIDLVNALSPPSILYPLGTDQFGRCVLSRILIGSRISLLMGIITVGIAATGGTIFGLIAGYFGGKVDAVIMRTVDLVMAFPGLILSLVILTILGRGLQNAMLAVGISSVPGYTRMIRGYVLSLKEKEFIEAARAVGCKDYTIIIRHILPHCLPLIIVLTTLSIPGCLLTTAALSFLGLGAQPPSPEWGRMLSTGREFLYSAWWIATFPGIFIFLVVLGLNLLGDGLRDALDPRLKM